MVKEKPRTFYDVIILDINMPIMNGIEAYDKITMYLEEKNITATLSKMCGGSHNLLVSQAENEPQAIHTIFYACTSEYDKGVIA